MQHARGTSIGRRQSIQAEQRLLRPSAAIAGGEIMRRNNTHKLECSDRASSRLGEAVLRTGVSDQQDAARDDETKLIDDEIDWALRCCKRCTPLLEHAQLKRSEQQLPSDDFGGDPPTCRGQQVQIGNAGNL